MKISKTFIKGKGGFFLLTIVNKSMYFFLDIFYIFNNSLILKQYLLAQAISMIVIPFALHFSILYRKVVTIWIVLLTSIFLSCLIFNFMFNMFNMFNELLLCSFVFSQIYIHRHINYRFSLCLSTLQLVVVLLSSVLIKEPQVLNYILYAFFSMSVLYIITMDKKFEKDKKLVEIFKEINFLAFILNLKRNALQGLLRVYIISVANEEYLIVSRLFNQLNSFFITMNTASDKRLFYRPGKIFVYAVLFLNLIIFFTFDYYLIAISLVSLVSFYLIYLETTMLRKNSA